MTNSASEPGDEDVLASIRRLVAATPERPSAANGAPPAPFPAGSAGDRLLLTPALRVGEPEAGEGAPLPPAPRGLTLEDRIAELEAAVGSQASDFEPDGSELAHVDPPEELVRAVENLEIDGEEPDEAAADAGAETAAEAPEKPSEPGRGHEPERRGLFLAASTPEPGASVPQARPEAPAGALTDLPAGLFFTRHDRAASLTPPDTPELVSELVPEPVPEPEAESAVAAASDADEVAVDLSGNDLSANLPDAPDEGARDDAPAHVEPGIEPAGAAHALPEFRHAAVFTASLEPARDAGTRPDAADLDAGAPEEIETPAARAAAGGLLDEEKLREIVAELLRDELQGPLGEKITRNIRKLVRREIERALTVRDFD